MIGTKFLYISKDNEVFKIPQPKGFKYKAINDLAGQEVLKVMLCYETQDRKPHQLIFVEFDRISLDAEGAFEHLNNKDVMNRIHNAFQFAFTTAEELANREEPFVLPIAPSIPSSKEKILLYDYLDKKFPVLGKDAPRIVEKKIRTLQESHQEKINMIKEAKKLRA